MRPLLISAEQPAALWFSAVPRNNGAQAGDRSSK